MHNLDSGIVNIKRKNKPSTSISIISGRANDQSMGTINGIVDDLSIRIVDINKVNKHSKHRYKVSEQRTYRL